MAEEKEKSIGALWEKSKADGGIWLSGSIEIDGKKTQIVAFQNSYKKEAKHPDYKIYVSKPREEAAKPNAPAPGSPEDEDLPF